MIQGAQRGKASVAGLIPSAGNVGGAPPASVDPAAPMFQECSNCLMRLSDYLKRNNQEVDANFIAKKAIEVDQKGLERRKNAAKSMADAAGGQASPASVGMGQGGGY